MITNTIALEPPVATDRGEEHILLPGQNPDGEYILSLLLKRSYTIIPDGTCLRADTDMPIYSGDVYYDGPMNSSIQYESDFVPYKPATDVVFNGSAHAPDALPVECLITSLTIGNYRKDIYITGNRTCRYRPFMNPVLSSPEPFITMPILYENAYGGVDVFSHATQQYPYPRNHVGRGFAVKNKRRTIEELTLPNIEDPDDILHSDNLICGEFKYWEDQPMPQGYGWFSKC